MLKKIEEQLIGNFVIEFFVDDETAKKMYALNKLSKDTKVWISEDDFEQIKEKVSDFQKKPL